MVAGFCVMFLYQEQSFFVVIMITGEEYWKKRLKWAKIIDGYLPEHCLGLSPKLFKTRNTVKRLYHVDDNADDFCL